MDANYRSGRRDDQKKTNLYVERLRKEQSVPTHEVQARMRWDRPILSTNQKCGVSLDLPVQNCRPTRACSESCYASQGRQMFRPSIVKSLAIHQMIEEDPERAARKMASEAAGHTIRIAGSGDTTPAYGELVKRLDEAGATWWGFTRRPDAHIEIPKLMFSVDATTPAEVLDYVKSAVPVGRRSYLRRPGDGAPSLDVAVTFPVHGPRTNYVGRTPVEKTDCPSVRKALEGCWACKRCY